MRTIGFAVTMAILGAATEAAAAEEPSSNDAASPEETDAEVPGTARDSATKEKVNEKQKAKPAEHVRFGLGLGLNFMANGQGSPVPTPTVSVGVSPHLGGPVWLIVDTSVSYSEANYDADVVARGFSGSGALGVRIETPAFDWLEIGGFGLAYGDYFADVNTADWYEDRSWGVGGRLGFSAHLRPSRFFGVRLSLDLLRVDHTWAMSATPVGPIEAPMMLTSTTDSTTVGFFPSPTVALTFTL